MNQPGTKPRPLLKAALKRANEYSEEIEVSNIQMMNGSSTNIRTPLTRWRMETQPGAGRRYVGRSRRALMFRNSGRFWATGMDSGFLVVAMRLGRRGQPAILFQCN